MPSVTATTAYLPRPDAEEILKVARAYEDFVLEQSGPKPMQARPATPESEAVPQNPAVAA